MDQTSSEHILVYVILQDCVGVQICQHTMQHADLHTLKIIVYGFRLIFCMAIWESISMAHVQSLCLGSFPSFFFSPLYARFYTRSLRVCEYRGTFSGEREKMSIMLFCNNTIFPLHHINYHQNHPCQKSWEYKNEKC